MSARLRVLASHVQESGGCARGGSAAGDFAGKVCLVTGGGRGIGREISLELARRGAHVIVHYNSNKAAAEATRADCVGGPHLVLQGSVEDPAQVERFMRAAEEWKGRLDVVVNNAGVYEPHPPSKLSYEEWQRAWDRHVKCNLTGAANVAFLAAAAMRRGGRGGAIVNVGSRGAYRGEPDTPAYGAAKAGLHSMAQSLAQAFGGDGISVTAVAPGFVETEMAAAALNGPGGAGIKSQSSWGRVAQPGEVAAAVCFLASPAAKFSTGTVVDVNGASYLR
eukprot:TRINITY_DN11126_c0_g1_i1.p1 TRINITY_DN11126_c0_g1~~TRINITY_DN11126_c0_g1_i1.p1  ORF type:complete len:309 (+),score=74.64 TRINITY_DN11126_c0_g1_i1:95-928(+)